MSSTLTPPPARVNRDIESVITGEAVALELRAASTPSRMLSGAIDLAVYGGLLLAIFAVVSRLATNSANAQALMIAAIATSTVIIPTAVETLARGRSLGRLVVGLRIVRDDGGPIRFRQAFVRAVIGVFELWLTLTAIALITSILNRRSKRIGDILAGTYSVRERNTDLALAPLLCPPELQAWARSADIRSMPSRLALAGHSFLSRAQQMKPEVRALAGRQLAASVEPFVSPPPPWGTHPERFLAAVLVARRDREYRAGTNQLHTQDRIADRSRRLPYDIPETG